MTAEPANLKLVSDTLSTISCAWLPGRLRLTVTWREPSACFSDFVTVSVWASAVLSPVFHSYTRRSPTRSSHGSRTS